MKSRKAWMAIVVLACSVVAAGGGCKFNTGLPGADGGPGNGGCPSGYNDCGAFCCEQGTTCGNGTCVYPYSTAHLYLYVCPNAGGSCAQPKYFSIGSSASNCAPAMSLTPGTCVDTGLSVDANTSYAFSNCQACGSNCSNPVSFATPGGFTSQTFTPGLSIFCGSECTVPESCGGASTGSSSSGSSSGGSSSGSTSSGGGSSSGTGSSTSSSGGPTPLPTCPAGSSTSCYPVMTCSKCDIQACACAGSNGTCSAWYAASDNQTFSCGNVCSTGGCSTPASQALTHCGCQ